jgi:hypothetical protein
MATAKAKTYLVCSSDGSWHHEPILTDDPESAVELSDTEWNNGEYMDTVYKVYELVSDKPVELRPRIRLTPA